MTAELPRNATSALPVIFSDDALAYGCMSVRQHDDGRVEALGEVPDRCAFSIELLRAGDNRITWDGKRITVTFDNGSWAWDAEARDPYGRIVYAGPTHD